MSTGFAAKSFDSLVKRLRDRLGAPEPLPLELNDQFLWSFLLWEASLADAERALKKISGAFIDLNELRVSLHEEIVSAIGPRYPQADERARRLRQSLHSVFLREHAISLQHLKDMPKRAARQYLDGLDGIPSFVAGRVMLLGLGGHATPLDQRILDMLISEGAFEQGTALDAATATLERHVKATDAIETHLLLLGHCESGGARKAPRGRAKSPRKAGAKAKKD